MDVLDQSLGSNTLQDWGISVLIVVATLLFAKFIFVFLKKIVHPLTQKTHTKADNIIYSSISSPIIFGIVLLGIWIAIHRLAVPEKFMTQLYNAYKILVVVNITWFFARLVNSLIEYWMHKEDRSPSGMAHNTRMVPVIKRTLLVLVWIIGIVMALSNVGVNITALIGTLGIGGIAFALAAQDTIKNIFGAFTLLTDKPFSIGDVVRIDNFEGTIVDVGIRSTKMRDINKRLITFPNYRIADASIINVSAEPKRRVTVKIGLTYDTVPEKMQEAMSLLKTIPSKVSAINANDLTVNFTEFADSALIITFIYNIENGPIDQTMSAVNMEILSSFNNAGLQFAFPSQTIYMSKG